MYPSNQNIETLGVTQPEEEEESADTFALQQLHGNNDAYGGTEVDAAMMGADQIARAESIGDDQDIEAGTFDELMQSLEDPVQNEIFQFVFTGQLSDPLRDAANESDFETEGDSQWTPSTATTSENPNHFDYVQDGVPANEEEQQQQARARKRVAEDDQQAEPPFDASMFSMEHVEALDRDIGDFLDQQFPGLPEFPEPAKPPPRTLRRVDDGLVDVKPTDIPFCKHSGKTTPGLRLLRALRRLQGRHTLQNPAELTFIRLILFEALEQFGHSAHPPAFLKKWEPGDYDKEGNATYRWDYKSKNATKTVLWVEASFKDVSKYFADNPGKTSFEEVWRQFLDEYGSDLPFPGTFISTMASIKQGTTIEDFVNVYESEYFKRRLEQLGAIQANSGLNVVEWSKQWAQRLARNNEGDDESLEAYKQNMARKLALQLLYSMYDRCITDNEPSTVSIVDIVNRFGIDRITRILRICLPMDRANALYNMAHTIKRKGNAKPTQIRGMIWYAKKRDQDIVNGWRAEGDPRMNEGTINKRLVWYFGIPELGLDQNRELVDLIQPCRTPVEEINDGNDTASA